MTRQTKQNMLRIVMVLFLLLVNTQYFWQGASGFVLGLFLMAAFVVLAVILLYQLLLAISERFVFKQRIATMCLMAVILGTALAWPSGLIDFERWEGEDLLTARYVGAANCGMTLKLKADGRAHLRSVCFGITTTRCRYRQAHDTILFDGGLDGRYKFAVLEKFLWDDPSSSEVLWLHLSADTFRCPMHVLKNTLPPTYPLQMLQSSLQTP